MVIPIRNAREQGSKQLIYPDPEVPTSHNKKVAACARFARSGEHGAERRAGNFWTLADTSEKGRRLK